MLFVSGGFSMKLTETKITIFRFKYQEIADVLKSFRLYKEYFRVGSFIIY